MYRVGHRQKKASNSRRYIFLPVAIVLIIVLVFLGGLFSKHLFRSSTVITQDAPVVSTVSASSTTLQTFQEPLFSLQLPNDWKAVAGEKAPYDIYRFQNGTSGSDIQLLEIYIDTIPVNYAVNKELAISGNGATLNVLGSVSDNCADFTKSASATPQVGTTAKWQGINFLCDLNNYERDVVGTSSANGVNTVTLNGTDSGSHNFFFAYTDNDINPDYTIFLNALSSFRVK